MFARWTQYSELLVEFTLGRRMLSKTDKLGGYILLEVLKPGDYYDGVITQTAFFLRGELTYSF